jgi:hypothetical protein
MLANVLGYQAVWFACVGGAAAGLAWPGVIAALVFAIATLALAGRSAADLRTLAVVLPLGFMVDSGLVMSGWISYSPAGPMQALAPIWIAAIWLAFAFTLNHSLAFLRPHRALSALLGLAGGPLAYWGASRAFGVIEFAQPAATTLVVVGLCWAVLLPLLFALDKRAPLVEAHT